VFILVRVFADYAILQPFSDNLRENVVRSNIIVLLHHSVKTAQRVMQAVLDFELEFHQAKHVHNLDEDLQSGEAGRMATAQVKMSLKELQRYLWRVAELFNRQKSDELDSLFALATELPRMADSMERSSMQALEEARYEIGCCTHKMTIRRDSKGLGSVWIVIFLLVSAGAFFGAYRVLAPIMFQKQLQQQRASKLF
jgi:hypothetical protein